jgi:hypothetical protein
LPEIYQTLVKIYLDRHGDSCYVWVIRHHCPPAELKSRMRQAIGEYLNSEEGRSQARSLGEFSWGDGLLQISKEDWARYGIIDVNARLEHTLELDANENFAKKGRGR